jgi:cell division protein FtsB
MLDYKQKNRIKSIMYSPLAVLAVAIIALYSLYSTWTIYSKLRESRRDLDVVQRQMLALDKQNTDIDQQVQSLQTPAGIEDEIRTKFGEAKAGESMAVIVESDATSSMATNTDASVWTKIKHFFGF